MILRRTAAGAAMSGVIKDYTGNASAAPLLHAVVSVDVGGHMLVSVVTPADDRPLVHVDSATLYLLFCLIGFCMRAGHRDTGILYRHWFYARAFPREVTV